MDALRNNWLNPSEWVRREVLEFPGSWDGPWRRFIETADERGIGTVKYPRWVAKEEHAAELKKRTLTALYNLRPAWLANAHATLDAAVLAAYGWPADITDDALLTNLLELNLSRGVPPHRRARRNDRRYPPVVTLARRRPRAVVHPPPTGTPSGPGRCVS